MEIKINENLSTLMRLIVQAPVWAHVRRALLNKLLNPIKWGFMKGRNIIHGVLFALVTMVW